MRLAVFSDVHGNLVALEAVLADIATRGADAIVNLGDCATGPLWPRETVELLDSLGLPTVRGNHDRWLAEPGPHEAVRSVRFTRQALTASQRSALATLPAQLTLDGDVLAVHGTPRSDTEYLLEEAVDGRLALARASILDGRLEGCTASLILCGHSHVQHVAEAPGGRLVVNPGSVGGPRYADNEVPSQAEAGSPHARYAIVTRVGGRWRCELFALEYDWDRVLEQARHSGRGDWAAAFLMAE